MYSLLSEAVLVEKIGHEADGTLGKSSCSEDYMQNFGCFWRVLLIFVFTLNHLECLGWLTALIVKLMHSCSLVASRVRRSAS